jgi:hypothetical protein
MTAPLKVRLVMEDDALSVVAALERIHVDVGSVSATKLDKRAPADMRLMVVAVTDDAGVAMLGADLRRELADDPKALALTNRVMVLPSELDTRLVVFLDIAAINA